MGQMKRAMAIALGAIFCLSLAEGRAFNEFKTPTLHETEVIGSYANGCLLGAEKLADKGPGYQTMRQSRNRHFGHPALIDYIEKLAKIREKKGVLLFVGDMSQPRGGLMNSSHASHQIGLDVDIWLYTMKPSAFKPAYIEKIGSPSVVDKVKGVVNADWRDEIFEFVGEAASFPEVDRIFINPVIKKELCKIDPNAPWQYKIRPWFGHDSHFHVRLKCPKGEASCLPQAPIPKTSGCTADLDNWIRDQSDYAINGSKPGSGKAKPRPPMPLRCQQLLQEQ